MQDMGKKSPNSPYCLTNGSTIIIVAVGTRWVVLESLVDIFGKKAAKTQKF